MSVRNGLLIAAAAGVISAGCATQGERPTAEITHAQTLIQQAEQAGAQQYAAAELDQARDKLRLATASADDGKQQKARFSANEAAADAQLALARTNSGEAKKAADEVHESTEALRRETTHEQAAPATPDSGTATPGTTAPGTTPPGNPGGTSPTSPPDLR